jgi:D-alanyl-D-alanine carboxypeptidase (penicillin-binding protein 5/6)
MHSNERDMTTRNHIVRLLVATALCIAALPVRAEAARLASDEIAGVPLSSAEISRSVAPDAQMRAGLLVGPDGRVLWAREAHATRAMASITKIMTALVILDDYRPDEVVVVTEAAARTGYAAGLMLGERSTVRELLELALVASSNDAAEALAIHTAGSSTAFVARMNERAKRMGLDHTRFTNPHGLDETGHHSSASDIAALSKAAMANSEYRRIAAMRSVVLPAREGRQAKRIPATNDLLRSYPGATGVKTGFTNDAGYCIASSAERKGVSLTAVVLGGSSSAARFRQATVLLDWGFEHVSMESLGGTSSVVATVPISANPLRGVPVTMAEATSVAVFDLDGAVTRDISVKEQVDLPIFEGMLLGQVSFRQGDRLLVRIPAVAASPVASADETVGVVPVADYLDRSVAVRADGSAVDVRPFDVLAPVDRRVDLDPALAAPVATGRTVGEIVYSQNGTVVARVPVVTAEAVEAPGLMTRVGVWFARGWRTMLGRPRMAELVVYEA